MRIISWMAACFAPCDIQTVGDWMKSVNETRRNRKSI